MRNQLSGNDFCRRLVARGCGEAMGCHAGAGRSVNFVHVQYLLVPNVVTDCSFRQCFQKWFVIPYRVHPLLFRPQSITSLGNES